MKAYKVEKITEPVYWGDNANDIEAIDNEYWRLRTSAQSFITFGSVTTAKH